MFRRRGFVLHKQTELKSEIKTNVEQREGGGLIVAFSLMSFSENQCDSSCFQTSGVQTGTHSGGTLNVSPDAQCHVYKLV